MADSIREQAIRAFITLMETITIANGYETDIGKKVVRGTTRELEKDELPAIIVNEGPERSDSTISAGKDHHYLTIEIAARMSYTEGESWYQKANKMLADITKAMGAGDTLGGLAIDLLLGSNKTGLGEGEKLIAGLDIDITIHYRTRHLDPYN